MSAAQEGRNWYTVQHRYIGSAPGAGSTLDGMTWSGIPAHKLSASQRRAVWEHIKRTDPDLAALLSGDLATELREVFGASPVFERELIARAEAAQP